MRQQARQYSAINSTSLVPSDSSSRPGSASGPRDQNFAKTWSPHDSVAINSQHSVHSGHSGSHDHHRSHDQHRSHERGDGQSQVKYISVEEHATRSRPPSGNVAQKRVQSAIDVKSLEAHRNNNSKQQSNLNLQSANATFNSFIDDAASQVWHSDLALAYSQVTGVTPQNYHTPSAASKQYQLLQQQHSLKQQSKVLLEQSKAKHQVRYLPYPILLLTWPELSCNTSSQIFSLSRSLINFDQS